MFDTEQLIQMSSGRAPKAWRYQVQPVSKPVIVRGLGKKKQTIEYAPQWWTDSQQIATVHPKAFQSLRQYVLRMSMSQCAAYLRVSRQTIDRWEKGDKPVPFAPYELLRILQQNTAFRLAHPEWEDWRMVSTTDHKYRPNAYLTNDKLGLSFTSNQLEEFQILTQAKKIAEAKIWEQSQQLVENHAKIAELQAELTDLGNKLAMAAAALKTLRLQRQVEFLDAELMALKSPLAEPLMVAPAPVQLSQNGQV